jgi:hypothetical protein
MEVPDPRGGALPQEPAAPITPEMASSLRRARPWALFLAFYGFLSVALGAHSALLFWSRPGGRVLGAWQWGVVMAMVLISFPLFRFARAIGRVRQGSGAAPVEEALARQRTLLRIVGIAALLELTLATLAVSIPLLREILPHDLEEGPPPLLASIARACDAQALELLCGTVALYDPEGKLLFWTGWHTFIPEPGELQLSTNPDGDVQLRFEGPGDNEWSLVARAPLERVLMPGEYTGVRHAASVAEAYRISRLDLRTPPAWFPLESGLSGQAPEWPGRCPEPDYEFKTKSKPQVEARFTIREILWARNGEARRISMDFQQTCRMRQGTWVVLGRVRATLHDERRGS